MKGFLTAQPPSPEEAETRNHYGETIINKVKQTHSPEWAVKWTPRLTQLPLEVIKATLTEPKKWEEWLSECWKTTGSALPPTISSFGPEKRLHMTIPQDATLTCPICQRVLSERSNLQRHIRDRHQLVVGIGREPPRLVEVPPPFPTTPGGRRKCPECEEDFRDIHTVTEHWALRRCFRPVGKHGMRWMSGNQILGPADTPTLQPPIGTNPKPEKGEAKQGTDERETQQPKQLQTLSRQQPHLQQTASTQPHATQQQAQQAQQAQQQRKENHADKEELWRKESIRVLAGKWCIENTAREVLKVVARVQELTTAEIEELLANPGGAWHRLTCAGTKPTGKKQYPQPTPTMEREAKRKKVQSIPPMRHKGRWRVATLNVQGKGNPEDVVSCCRTHNIDIMAATETHVRKQADFKLKGYRCIFAQSARGEAGVGFVVRDHIGAENRQNPRHSVSPPVLRVRFFGSRCGLLETKQSRIRVSLVVAYAPTNPKTVEERAAFWGEVHRAVAQAKGRVILLGDFNAQVPNRVLPDPPNENGTALQNVAAQHSLCFRSLEFRKPKAKSWTWVGHLETLKRPRVLDYILCQQDHARDIEDCNVRIPALVTDHKMVIAELKAKWAPRRDTTRKERLKVVNTNDRPATEAEQQFTVVEKLYEALPRPREKQTKRAEWLDDKTLEAISLKGQAFVRWKLQPSPTTYEAYKVARNTASKLRTAAWNKYWDNWAVKVEQSFVGGKTGEGFALLARAYRASHCRLPADESDVMECRQYFCSLLQEEPPRPKTEVKLVEAGPLLDPSWGGPSDEIPTDEEVTAAMTQMRTGAPGKDGMRIEQIRKDKALTAATCALVRTAWKN